MRTLVVCSEPILCPYLTLCLICVQIIDASIYRWTKCLSKCEREWQIAKRTSAKLLSTERSSRTTGLAGGRTALSDMGRLFQLKAAHCEGVHLSAQYCVRMWFGDLPRKNIRTLNGFRKHGYDTLLQKQINAGILLDASTE